MGVIKTQSIARIGVETEVSCAVWVPGGHNGFFPKNLSGPAAGGSFCSYLRQSCVSPSRLCQKVRPAMLGLSRSLADAQLLWPEVQRQRLSADERSGRSDLAESGVLAG